jgi:hypothetical protein
VVPGRAPSGPVTPGNGPKNKGKIQFHKDNLRHLSRFPDFFVTKRILSSPPSCFFLVTQTWGLSERVERKNPRKKPITPDEGGISQVLPAVTNDFLFHVLYFYWQKEIVCWLAAVYIGGIILPIQIKESVFWPSCNFYLAKTRDLCIGNLYRLSIRLPCLPIFPLFLARPARREARPEGRRKQGKIMRPK